MVGEWKECTLGDVLELQRGFDLPTQERLNGAYPIIASTGIVGFHSEAMVKAPGVVIGRSGSLGGGQYVTHDFWPLNTTLWVKDFKGNDVRFCFYLLKSIDFNNFNVGGAVPTLNRNHVHPLPIRVPYDIPEQRAIAHILGTLDDKIELNRKQNETLEEMARTIFRAWFVDFAPVRAKMDGRWRRGESLPGLPAHLYDLFPDRLVESELGEIPEGWRVGSITDTVEIIGGGTPKTSVSEYWNGEIPWFSVVDTPLLGDVFVVETEKSITQAGLNESSARLIPKGTTIISARGTIGNLAIAGRSMAFNQSCYALRGKSGSGNYYVFYSAQHMVERLKTMAHGSVFSTITRNTFESVYTVLPPENVLQQFEKNSTKLLDSILANVNESRSLTQLRDTLLPKLISGELRVGDVEHIVGAAV